MEHKKNVPLFAAGSLVALAGCITIVTFVVLIGKFPPMKVVWAPLVEIVAGVALVTMRNRIVLWLSLLCVLGMAGLHGYHIKRFYDLAEMRAATVSRSPYRDTDTETNAILSRVSRIEKTRKVLNWFVLGIDLVALVVVFGTRRGRAALSE